MEVDPASAVNWTHHKGETYYFCSPSCHSRFNAHPEKFLQNSKTPLLHHSITPRLYTCPMHPEIEHNQPGDCPICGMTLELKTISPDSVEDNPELRDMTRRFWIGAVLTLPVFLLAMSHLVPHL